MSENNKQLMEDLRVLLDVLPVSVREELERIDTTLRVVMSVHMGLCSMALL